VFQSIKEWASVNQNTIIKSIWIAALLAVIFVVGMLLWAGSSGLPTFE